MTLKSDVERLYNDGVLVKNIMRELDLNDSKFYEIVRELKAENRLILRTVGQKKWGNQYHKNPKHYSYCTLNGYFQIVYKRRYYGCVKTKRQAERFVELMKECDWDYDKRDEVKKMVLRE